MKCPKCDGNLRTFYVRGKTKENRLFESQPLFQCVKCGTMFKSILQEMTLSPE